MDIYDLEIGNRARLLDWPVGQAPSEMEDGAALAWLLRERHNA